MRSNKVFPYLMNVKRGKANGPVSLQVGLTHECINKCIMCQHWARPNANPKAVKYADTVALLTNVIKPFVHMDGETICFSGGEPFNHPDLLKINEWCQPELGIGYITSGAGLSVNGADDKVYQSLAKCEWIRISLDAVDKGIYEQSRGPGFDDVMTNIPRYVKAGCKLGFGITLHKRNAWHVPEAIEWIKKNIPVQQIESIRLWFVRGEKELELDDDSKLSVKNIIGAALGRLHETVDTNFDAFEKQAQGFPEVHPDSLKSTRCVVPLLHLYIDASLRAFACCVHAGDAEIKPAGPVLWDMTKKRLDEVWEEILENEDKKHDYGQHKSCEGCTLRLFTINENMRFIEDYKLHRRNFI